MDNQSLRQFAEAFERQQQWPEAILAWQTYLSTAPNDLLPVLGLTRIYRSCGDLDQARAVLVRALEQHPESPELFRELGLLFLNSGQLEYAVRYFQQALLISPASAPCYYQLGLIFQQEGHQVHARRYFEQAVLCQAAFPEAWHALGICCLLEQDFSEACTAFTQAVALKSENPEYHKNLGLAYLELRQEESAHAHFLQAIALDPHFATTYFQIAHYYLEQRQFLLASLFLKLALKGLGVRRSLIYNLLAYCAFQLENLAHALYFYRAALRENPEDAWPEVAAATLLPHLYLSAFEVRDWRQRILTHLNDLARREWQLPPHIPPGILHGGQNFLLAYQGVDNRLLLEKMTAFWQRHFVVQPPVYAPKGGRQEALRVAIISAHFYRHPVSSCFQGVYQALMASSFEVAFFQIGSYEDDFTRQLRAGASYFEAFATDMSVSEMAGKIKSFAPDLVIYPEIGMDQITWLLSLYRLAPVQCVLPGHPVTTGNPEIDYFISMADFEPEKAQQHYTESLVCMPASFLSLPLPVCHGEPPERQALGFPEHKRIYLVPATLFKIHPDMDRVFGLILQRDPEAVIAFIQVQAQHWHEKLQQRFQQTLPDAGARLLFLPWTDQQTFLWRLSQADIVLDTFYFGLGTTAYQAFGLGVPVITWPGQWLRARGVYGLYRQMGIQDCCAFSPEDYVDKACTLALDRRQYQAIRAQIIQRSPLLFESESGIQALMHFFQTCIVSQGLESRK